MFLQYNSYSETTIKFFMENAHDKYEMVYERIFEDNLTNKINLKGRRKNKIKFQR